MITIYVYTHDTMADWEIGHVTAELHSGRFFKQDTLEAWYAYFSTGEAQHFFALMQTLPSAAQ